MKKCPKIVRGIKNKIKWLFKGYSYSITIDQESSYACEAYYVYDIIKNLRNRAYEHLIVNDNTKVGPIQFIQTITNGKAYRVEVSVIDMKGKKHIIMYETTSHLLCADIFFAVLFLKMIPDLKWVDISNEKWNGKDIDGIKDIIYFNPEWVRD